MSLDPKEFTQLPLWLHLGTLWRVCSPWHMCPSEPLGLQLPCPSNSQPPSLACPDLWLRSIFSGWTTWRVASRWLLPVPTDGACMRVHMLDCLSTTGSWMGREKGRRRVSGLEQAFTVLLCSKQHSAEVSIWLCRLLGRYLCPSINTTLFNSWTW